MRTSKIVFGLLLTVGPAALGRGQAPHAVAENNQYMATLMTVDCSGHQGRTTVCFKNASPYTIIKARCGSYDVPILTLDRKIAPGETAAVVDLGNSTRTCRREGITATTSGPQVLKGQLNGANVDDSTEVWFVPQ